MKQLFSALILFLFCFSNSTCKKISNYPFDMFGLWVCNDEWCDGSFIDIPRSGHGKYGALPGDDGCDNKQWSGKVRYTDEALFVGHVKLKFIQKPEEITGDSLLYRGDNVAGYQQITAQMTIKTTFLYASRIFTFYKIKNY